MFGWMSRCWGGFGVNSQYERARVRSIITDWKVPDDNDLCSNLLKYIFSPYQFLQRIKP